MNDSTNTISPVASIYCCIIQQVCPVFSGKCPHCSRPILNSPTLLLNPSRLPWPKSPILELTDYQQITPGITLPPCRHFSLTDLDNMPSSPSVTPRFSHPKPNRDNNSTFQAITASTTNPIPSANKSGPGLLPMSNSSGATFPTTVTDIYPIC